MENQNKSAVDIAYDLKNEVMNCMSDLAGGNETLADALYNNPYMMSDLIGDKIFDSCGCLKTDDDKILAWQVCENLIEIGHTALVQAVENFKIKWDFF